jgi:hypothetical protein
MTQLCISNEDIVGELAQNLFPLVDIPFDITLINFFTRWIKTGPLATLLDWIPKNKTKEDINP